MTKCKMCGNMFPSLVAMFYCPECREIILKRRPGPRKAPVVVLQRDPTDWQLWDENHNLVWARDLAKKYRNELERRQQRDYRERIPKWMRGGT